MSLMWNNNMSNSTADIGKPNHSSRLLDRLTAVNWLYSIKTMLCGAPRTLLIKYIIEDDAYALMLSDFASTYFECMAGDQLKLQYSKHNRKDLGREQILSCIAELLRDLRHNGTQFEKLEIDCHTTRLTVRTFRHFPEFRFQWNFYSVATSPDVFYRNFSMPLFRAVVYYYNRLEPNFGPPIEVNNAVGNGDTENDQEFTVADSHLNQLFRSTFD